MMFSLFKIMLTISYTTTVTLRDLFECRQKCSKHKFRGRPFLRRMRF